MWVTNDPTESGHYYETNMTDPRLLDHDPDRDPNPTDDYTGALRQLRRRERELEVQIRDLTIERDRALEKAASALTYSEDHKAARMQAERERDALARSLARALTRVDPIELEVSVRHQISGFADRLDTQATVLAQASKDLEAGILRAVARDLRTTKP